MTDIGNETPEIYIPVRMINEFVYCPRLFYLEWVENEFRDSEDTVEGRLVHRNVDIESGSLMRDNNSDSGNSPTNLKATSVFMSSSTYGISSRMDVVEETDGKMTPVEYKKSKSPDNEHNAWPSDIVQVCAQALILKDNGFPVERGILFYAGSKRRISVEINSDLIARTVNVIESARKLSASGKIPPPLRDSPKCQRCSIASLCLPDETVLLAEENIKNSETEVRRLYPARYDTLPLYVVSQGATIGKSNEELEVKIEGKIVSRVRMLDVSHLSVFGNVQITTQTIHELCRRNISITYFTTGGWFNGITTGLSHRNVLLRQSQYLAALEENKALSISRIIVEGKIRNCRTLIRRNSKICNDSTLLELQLLYRRARTSRSFEELLGIEGNAARIYFSHLGDMLKNGHLSEDFHFEGRNRRPPLDPINAILSLLYALLTKDVTVTLLSIGFDPYLGFYHKPKYGKPALALDLMEEFRPLIADSTLISLINGEMIKSSDFIQRGIGTSLTDNGRRRVIREYEKRLDSLITHPIFGYTVSYRRIIEVQCRLVARWLMGEIQEYKAFSTR